MIAMLRGWLFGRSRNLSPVDAEANASQAPI